MKVPVATYRVQLNKMFNFDSLKQLLPYLSQLGISHIYASPIFGSKKGSTHGYDIVDPNQISDELGGRAAFESLIYEVSGYGLEWMQDIVPNHQSYSLENKMIYDLMQKGPFSKFYDFFDVDWNNPASWLKSRILAPFLAEPYSDCLKKGLISLVDENGLKVRYNGITFPVNTSSNAAEVKRYTDPAILKKFLSQQFYALAYWKIALKQINYRRFFDIIDLIGVCVENKDVFETTHRLIFELTSLGKFSTLRVDHIDGLYDPEEYLKRLRAKFPNRYMIVEKILSGNEQMQTSWPIQGTTGYEFINFLNNLFIKRDNEPQVDAFYKEFTGNTQTFSDLLYDCKKAVTKDYFLGDIENLARLINETLGQANYGKRFSDESLRKAVMELLACLPVYRTYNSPQKQDFKPFKLALILAKQKNEHLSEEWASFDYLLEQSQSSPEALHAIMRLQQFTGAVMAKGLEDTAFYRYSRFLSANEVGCNPARLGCSREEFHEFIGHRQRNWPFSLNATSTHDTKRGEDVRARLNVISEIPAMFEMGVMDWAKINAAKKKRINGKVAPGRSEEYYLYQTLLGTFPWELTEKPEFTDRLKLHMIKALREAKQNSNWLLPNLPYEQAVSTFAEDILNSEDFLQSFLPLQQKIAFYGFFNSLSQTLLKAACPGIPDFYQGTELWDLNLVDPDNRRPVNFQKRQEVLSKIAELVPSKAPSLLKSHSDGKAKLYAIYKALELRRKLKELFNEGTYLPLAVNGASKSNVVAFMRNKGSFSVIVVVPRFVSGLIKAQDAWASAKWADTSISLPQAAPSIWKDVFTDAPIRSEAGWLPVKDVLGAFPVALLLGGLQNG